ncbi:hypothetical protein FRB95_014925 [Tulasnella sp. JGI-2019a]|nr:hypothetical protein FRB95_014925 [Tulasnella sp. JGI-2019a]
MFSFDSHLIDYFYPLGSAPPALSLARAIVIKSQAASLAFTSLFLGVPDTTGLKRTVVSERFRTTLRIVENSRICATTPGVQTISGYIDIGDNQNYASKTVQSIFPSEVS